MKRFLYILTLVSVLLFSCKKDQRYKATPAQKKYDVKFNVSDLNQQIIDVAKGEQQLNSLKTTNSLGEILDVLYYAVFKPDGSLVTFIMQKSSQANFGTVTDQLPAGTYEIDFVGGKSGLVVGPFLMGSPSASYKYHSFSYTNNISQGSGGVLGWNDLFFKQLNLTVPAGNLSQDVTLNRVTAKLTIKLLDTLPADAQHIDVKLSTEYPEFTFDKSNLKQYGNGQPVTYSFTTPSSFAGTTNYIMSMLVMNTVTPVTVTIDAYNSAGTRIGEAVVNNILLQNNTQTILSGKLFGSSNGVNTGLNTAWDGNFITVNF